MFYRCVRTSWRSTALRDNPSCPSTSPPSNRNVSSLSLTSFLFSWRYVVRVAFALWFIHTCDCSPTQLYSRASYPIKYGRNHKIGWFWVSWLQVPNIQSLCSQPQKEIAGVSGHLVFAALGPGGWDAVLGPVGWDAAWQKSLLKAGLQSWSARGSSAWFY